jgi:hypothetical protein
VAVTGLSVFSAGIEIFVTARIRPSASHPEQHLPGGPRDLAASRSFRFGLQFSAGGKPPAAPAAAGQTTISSQRARSCTRSSAAADRTRSSPGGGCGRCRPLGRWSSSAKWPAFGIAESRTGIDAQLILDAARRAASGYGQKTKADGGDP